MISGSALQYGFRSYIPRHLTSSKASLAAWNRHSRVLITLIAASLCLAVILGVKSGSSHAHLTQELETCHIAVEVKTDQFEALLAKHTDDVKRYRLHEESRVVMERSRDAAKRQVETMKEEVKEAHKELEIARDLASSLLQEQTNLKQQLERQLQTKIPEQTDRHAPWLPSSKGDQQNAELAAVLRRVAINNEVMIAISDRNYATPNGMLTTWLENVKLAGVKNVMVVALDAQTKARVEAQGVTAHEMHLTVSEAQKNVGSNHAVSGLKFKILRHFLQLGYSVLLSDVDIITLQNPFRHLHRDSDVEAMSDGWDNATAYGYNDVLDDAKMGWSRYIHSMRVFVFNSGLFYIRPTLASLDLLDRIAHRLDHEDGWDQAIFNEVIFFPSHGDYRDPSVTRRVLDYMNFMNSKTLFTNVRKDQTLQHHKPVTIHVNFHPDKHARMQAVVRRYVHGDVKALDGFPDGSE